MRVRGLVGQRNVFSVSPDMSVLDVARYMSQKRIGAVAVVANDVPVGVFSERDLMERVVSKELSPATTRVEEVMSRDLVMGDADDSHMVCMLRMQDRGCRHLPLTDNGKYIGMLSLRDLLRLEVDEKNERIKWMNAYIHDETP